MIIPSTPEDVAAVRDKLPADAESNGWTDEKIAQEWTGWVPTTVRLYWLQRVNDTVMYINLPKDGLPANQIHDHAVAMLKYWDDWCNKHRPTRMGQIRNRREQCGC